MRPFSRLSIVAVAVALFSACPFLSFAGGDDDDDDDDDDVECGDDDADGDEACDGTDLRGETCESLGFAAGTLTCLATCDDFDRQGCGAPDTCGDDTVQAPEVCDGADLAGAACVSLGYGDGPLACAANCGNYDVSACPPPDGCVPDCGGAVCGLDPVCGTACGACGDGFACDAGACVVIPRCTDPDELVEPCAGGACVLDLDVALLAVDTAVRIDGLQPVNIFTNFGEVTVRFTDTSTGVAFSYGFESDSARETFLVPAGRYDVDLIVIEPASAPGAPTGTPLRAAENVDVSADRALDLDVALLAVDTAVRVDGLQPVNIFTNFGEVTVRFTSTTTGVAFSYGFESDSARETFLVPGGTYDVDLIVIEPASAPGAPTGTPLRALENVAVDADRDLDVDVALFAVDTGVRVDGLQPVNIFTNFGEVTVRFTSTTTGVAFSYGFESDSARETFLVPNGSYDVDLIVIEPASAPGAPTGTPLRALANVAVNGDRQLDVDVPLFAVDTAVRVDGLQPVNIFTNFGEVTVRFTNTSTGVAFSYGFESDSARETFLVPNGSYHVDLIVIEPASAPGAPTGTPLRALANVAVSADRDLDVDVPLFAVDTGVRVDGLQPVNIFTNFGEVTVRFTDTSTGVAFSYGFESDSARETFLVPNGSYDVDLIVIEPASAPGAPTGTPLRALVDVAVNADRALDADVALVDVDTAVRIDGLQPVNIFTNFGEITVRFTDTETRVAFSYGFESDSARETFLVPEGTYDIDLIVIEPASAPGAPTGTPLRALECVVVAEN